MWPGLQGAIRTISRYSLAYLASASVIRLNLGARNYPCWIDSGYKYTIVPTPATWLLACNCFNMSAAFDHCLSPGEARDYGKAARQTDPGEARRSILRINLVKYQILCSSEPNVCIRKTIKQMHIDNYHTLRARARYMISNCFSSLLQNAVASRSH